MSDSYFLGATVMFVGLSAPLAFSPPKNCNGFWFKNQAGGSLFIGSGLSQQASVLSMYNVASGEVINVSGPAQFFLYAGGATVTVGLGLSYSAGLSSPIVG